VIGRPLLGPPGQFITKQFINGRSPSSGSG
jgi:hypothetical protein